MKPLNTCGSWHDFTSLRLFGAHPVGGHEHTDSEGAAVEPIREDGRRCLTATEMTERAWVEDIRGRWHDPARSADLQTRLAA